jgi:hypothetical protein
VNGIKHGGIKGIIKGITGALSSSTNIPGLHNIKLPIGVQKIVTGAKSVYNKVKGNITQTLAKVKSSIYKTGIGQIYKTSKGLYQNYESVKQQNY